ncbi:MAG: PAS domain S-box protein [Bryobacteraceae bacterium]
MCSVGPSALEENHARLAAALLIGKLGTFEWNVFTDAVMLDDRSREIFGFGPGQGLTAPEVFDRIHPDDRQRVMGEAQRSREELSRLETEYRIVLPDGSIRSVASLNHAIRGPDGTAERMVGVFSDITERKQAEAKLLEQEEQLRRLLAIDTVAVIFFDLSGNVTGANDAFLRMSGYTRDDLDRAPLRWDIMTPPEWMDASLKTRDELAATGGARPYEKQYIRRDGSRWWGLFAPKMLNDRQAVEFILDITERKQAEEALRESEERFRRAFSNAAVGLVLSARDGRLLHFNAAYCEILGYTAEELRDKDLFEITYPDDVPRNRELHTQLLSGAIQNFVIDKRYVRKDGQVVWVRATAKVMTEEAGQPVQIVGIVENIQDRKEAEAALMRSREELAQFAHTVAHDLQTPLRGLITYSQLLARRYGGSLDNAANEFLDFIVDGARNMENLIRALLRYAEVGDDGTERITLSLGDVIEDVLALMQQEIADSGAEIRYADLPDLQADRVQLTQLFQNLIGNAIKYRKPGDPPRITLSAKLRPTGCLFAVEDNGQGMDPRYSESIFQPLKRLHGRDVPGSGIGLAICKKIVERYGGRIWVESEPGKGSTFFFTIPCV